MPDFSAINGIATALQAQCVASLNSASEINFTVSSDSFVLGPPSRNLASSVVSCLYLYHAGIDPHLRNQRMFSAPAEPSLMISPPLPLQRRFLLVPRHSDEDNHQLILGRILQHFHDAPVFRPTPGSALASSRGENIEKIRVRHDQASYQDLATLWSGLAEPYRLSAGFIVDTITIDSAKPSEPVARVDEILGATRRLKTEAGG